MNFVFDLLFVAIGELLSAVFVLPISVLTQFLISFFAPSTG